MLGGMAPHLGFAALAAQEFDERLVRAQCEAVHQIPGQSILYGLVVDGRTATPLPGSSVHLRWTGVDTRDTTVKRATAESGDGAYIFCDVPQDTELTAWADAMGGSSEVSKVVFRTGESIRQDFAVRLETGASDVDGVLTDATTGAPIEGATITLDRAGVSALSDRNGRFRLSEVPAGIHEIEIRHVAYGRPGFQVAVDATQNTHLSIELDPKPLALEPISVEIARRTKWLDGNGFYRRQDRGLGRFVTPEALAIRPGRRFHEVLREVPGVRLRTVCTPYCYVLIRMAGSTVRNCLPTFYMDGREVHINEAAASRWAPRGLIDLNALVVGADLAAIEVYRSIAETPPQFYGRCGSIVIWTKRGAG